jgi:4-hydroxy-3-polyprenylbenzoate decarboxylase
MGYRNLRDCVRDLERTRQLVRIEQEVDPYLEAAEIQRRVYRAGGPAVYFARVKSCAFPMVCNLFGTLERARFLFRDTLAVVRKLIQLKIDPAAFVRRPWRYWNVPFTLLHMLPKHRRRGPVTACETTIRQLPQQVSWPKDGGAFITLPLVYTEDPDRPGWRHSNLGMYRVQLSGNEYDPDREVGLHYQIHRGIGVHHAAAVRRGEPLRVSVSVGGPPALILAAVMPLPEGMPELTFAGALGGRRVRLIVQGGALPFPAEADFVITGSIEPLRTKPEGPFGDHLGYYSLQHPFPVMRVDKVYYRREAIWPFTVVGRPPQEDTTFGALIHEITGPIIPTVIPGVHAVHAVDAAGVHPLLLAIGSERYVPYAEKRKPQELLTCANAILGQGQLSLAKYLFIVAKEDNPNLDVHDIPAFFRHVLERVDWGNNLHFQTRTTMDTLDYSGGRLNEGSKVVIAAAGPPQLRRTLGAVIPSDLKLPEGFDEPRVCLPGILVFRGPKYQGLNWDGERDPAIARFVTEFPPRNPTFNEFPLIVIVDDSSFAAASLQNFIWMTFTRSDPATDIHGMFEFTRQKHWGCTGPLVIDARIKPHHAPPLIEDPAVSKRVDALGAPGGPLHGII